MKGKKQQDRLNVHESYNLWDRVAPKYLEMKNIEDDYLFRMLIMGIQGAGIVHAEAVKQCTTNDRIRKYFIELLMSEIDTSTRIIKLGKIKGWLNEPPHYSLI